MAYHVNFKEGQVETTGLESSPVAETLAGLRANEARYFWNKYKFEYVTFPAVEKEKEVAWLKKLLKEERDLEFASPILEVAIYEDEDIYWPEFYFEDGMVINVLYEKTAEEGKKNETCGWLQTFNRYGNTIRAGWEIQVCASAFKTCG